MKINYSHNNKRIIILVLSCENFYHRRISCYNTWFGDILKNFSKYVTPLFFSFSKINRINKIDILEKYTVYLECTDDYDSVPKKIYSSIEYINNNYDYDYIFKCDDDTYINIENLLKFLENKSFDYCGREAGIIKETSWVSGSPYSGNSPTNHTGLKNCNAIYAGGGAGYFLSKKSSKIILKNKEMFEIKGPEDVIVGYIMNENNINLVHSDLFCHNNNGYDIINNISLHQIRDSNIMEKIYHIIKNRSIRKKYRQK